MSEVEYYLVCHDTKTKVRVGRGEHRYEIADFYGAALARFFYDNIAFPLGLEWAHEGIAAYGEYLPDEENYDEPSPDSTSH